VLCKEILFFNGGTEIIHRMLQQAEKRRETDGYPIYSITMDDLRAAVEEEDFFT
jgi:uncharacterized phage-like protein YoqJ